MSNTATATRTATDIACSIRDIKAAAFGMGCELNAGQAAIVARLEAELAAATAEEA